MRLFIATLVGCILAVAGLLAFTMNTQAQQAEAAKPATDRIISGTFTLLGANTRLTGFNFVVLYETPTGPARRSQATDAEGRYSIKVPAGVTVRFFATGDFNVPASWTRVAPGAADISHDVFVRPLGKVKLRGRVVLPGSKPAREAQVYIAPLDQLPDGSYITFDSPYFVETDADGNYFTQVPSGYYQIWSYWADRETEDWTGFFQLIRHKEVFEATTVDMALDLRPRVKGRIVDGESGKPVSATLDLYSSVFLRHLQVFTGDDSGWNKLPVGVFDVQLQKLDEQKFNIVVRAEGGRRAIRLIEGLSLDSLAKLGDIKVRDPAAGKLEITLKTRDRGIALANKDISISPTGPVKAPPYMRDVLDLTGYTEDAGRLDLWGLPPGKYTLFAELGAFILMELDVKGGVQKVDATLDIPFVFGTITYPDGTPCKRATCTVEFTWPDGSEGWPDLKDAFGNPAVRDNGMFFLDGFPVRPDLNFTFTFGAGEPSETETPFDVGTKELPYVSEAVKVTFKEAKGHEFNIKLAKNPKAVERTPRKENQGDDDSEDEAPGEDDPEKENG